MATYNCSDSTNSAYGASSYGTCTGQTVGAPNTGFFSQLGDSGSFTIIAPFIGAIVITAIATLVIGIRKKHRRSADTAK